MVRGSVAIELGAGMGQREFDLEKRTGDFGDAMVRFLKSVRVNVITHPLIDQAVRSSTSVGANYLEANNAESRRDFRHKIGLCRKEARESTHWIKMLVAADAHLADAARPLWREADELSRIFASIVQRMDANDADGSSNL